MEGLMTLKTQAKKSLNTNFSKENTMTLNAEVSLMILENNSMQQSALA